jgi:hypothetical protein
MHIAPTTTQSQRFPNFSRLLDCHRSAAPFFHRLHDNLRHWLRRSGRFPAPPVIVLAGNRLTIARSPGHAVGIASTPTGKGYWLAGLMCDLTQLMVD